MKISYNWLNNYVQDLPAPDKLAEMLTDCGLEVEATELFQSVKGGLNGVVIGEVEQCVKHPNADKLSLTRVNIGKADLLSIVCGAPNIEAGQKVLVATIGTMINSPKGEFVIEKTKIRGEVSEGMICAEDELGLGTSHSGIMVLQPDAIIGMPAKVYFNIEEDFVFEIGLTPNRSDATSHFGVARDIIALVNCAGYQANATLAQINLPSIDAFNVDNKSLTIPVIIEDKIACPRYSGITLSGVKVASSPVWLVNKIKAIGLRPINNIVDITNYVLYETGQPLHAFDADMITGGKVIIKKLPKASSFITLDGIKRELTGEDLMICNANEGMCMAGVFGGEKSGVSEKTTKIFLESACFDSATVRKTSKHHNLKTDASFRFERGSDINMTIYALKRVAIMIREIAGGEITSEIIDVCSGQTGMKQVELLFENLDKIAGKHIDQGLVKNILGSLDIMIKQETNFGLELLIPTAKVDVTREIDVVEEILRIYGFNNIEIPSSLRTSISYRSQPDREAYRNVISDFLSANGFFEIMTNSLTSSSYSEKFQEAQSPANVVRILNPLSRELNVMRQSLLFGGMETLAYNQNRKNPDMRCYEFGNVYHFNDSTKVVGLEKYAERMQLAIFLTGNSKPENWLEKTRKTDFYWLKNYSEQVLRRLGVNIKDLNIKLEGNFLLGEQLHYYSGSQMICSIGILVSSVLKYFDLKDEVYFACFEWDALVELASSNKISYHEVSKFPEVRRDLALLIDREVTWKQLENIAFETEKKLLKEVNLFDVYADEKMAGKKSYAISFIIQDNEKTLTDAEIDAIMQKLISAYNKKLGAILR